MPEKEAEVWTIEELAALTEEVNTEK